MANRYQCIDSGWSWMILGAASIIVFLWAGIAKALSVLLPTLKDQFETHTWIIGAMIMMMISVRDFSAPVVGALATSENTRILALVGGTFVGLSTICASFVDNVLVLGILISIINGIAFAFITIPAYALLGQYFDKLYPLATGVFYSFGILGLMVFAPLTQFLLSTYGWRNILLLIGATNVHLVACAALLHSPVKVCLGQYASLTCTSRDLHLAYFTSSKKNNYENFETFGWMSEPAGHYRKTPDKLLEQSGILLFKNRSFLAVCVMLASIDTTYAGWIVYFIPHCLVKGLPAYEASFLATAAGFANLIGHVIYIPFVSRNIISVRGCIYISGAVAAISLFVDKFTVTITTISIANVLYMCAAGVAYPLCDVVLKSVVGSESLAKAFGWRLAISGLVRLLPGFLLGWIYDHTGSYDAAFFFLGAVQAFGVIVLVVDHLCHPRE
ncbi:monocarboxylate transporter 11-like [Amphiura filiformis]|uniref:monocarboxylate transporter 11-like n=1 Tax=Amphiura filiformis TaxID=82378 RepID=UPI003B214DCA